MKNISEHITYKSAIYSATAERFSIDNTPTELQLQNMRDLAENIFEPLRLGLGGLPILISSFFRSRALNKRIGGAKTSQHMCNNGSAIDLDNDAYPELPSNKQIFDYIKDHLEFDQVISEFPDDNDFPNWTHVSFNKGKNRRQVLVSHKHNGITVYEKIN